MRAELPRPSLPVLACLSLLLGQACGGGDSSPPALVESSANPRQNVLVLDDGFDPTVAAFRGKVAGRYTIVCQNPSNTTTATRRAQVIANGDAGAGGDDGGAP